MVLGVSVDASADKIKLKVRKRGKVELPVDFHCGETGIEGEEARPGQYSPGRDRTGQGLSNPHKHLLSSRVLVCVWRVVRRQLMRGQEGLPITSSKKC